MSDASPQSGTATTYRAVCYQHMETQFPVRADRLDASEDTASHMNTPGGHHVDILEVDLEPTEVAGFPAGGFARNELPKLLDQALRAMAQMPYDPTEDETEGEDDE
ncbi:hypothetical protein [Gryllotalpicola protaetiae]|uniref:Uncharacterized protein n=1 Tax=Gryllotalpicola protaetiae TaxID=2419771 RepID=A0A387BXG1_9MICO|nr:hypothetical protein [Gryllotalpicola protaetiae]AYG05537.1 hypothetical protein D7I44_17820 [Gryllotalpicola protaetiae]